MTASLLITISITAIISVWTPGPNNIMLLGLAGKYGIRANFRYLLGIWTGCILLTLASGLLCQTLAAVAPKIQPVMKYIGAAYLVYLAYKTLLRKPPKDSDIGNIPSFVEGMMLQVLNIKLILYALTMYSTYILPNTDSWPAITFSAFFLVFFSATGNLVWALAGNFLKPLYEKHYRIANIVMALLLLWCILKMLGLL